MFPLAEKDKTIARLLFSTGTCPRCIFRFCCVDFHAPYKLPYKDLLRELENFLRTEDDALTLEATEPPPKKIRLQDTEAQIDDRSQNGGEMTTVVKDENMVLEKPYLNACNLCLGILQEFCEKKFIKKVCQKVESSGYEFVNLVFSVSFPPQLSVREVVSDISRNAKQIF